MVGSRVLLVLLTLVCLGAGPVAWDTAPDTWVGVDRQGRILPTAADVRPPQANRTLAVFYFLWNDTPGRPVYDLGHILAADPAHPQFGPVHDQHWWGQPWFGYYTLQDRSVVRKHVQMLVDAGVDLLVFDATNGPKNTYPAAREAVCQILEERRATGQACPKIAFFAGGGSWQRVYDDFYAARQHPDLWFQWQGKPLLMIHHDSTHAVSDDVRRFFTLRESWAWTGPGQEWFGTGADRGRDCWAWLDDSPQNYGWHDGPAVPEEVSVSVAQHATSSIGRSYSHCHGGEPRADACCPARGTFFAEQWDRALQIDPPVVFVTGWNEWMAQRSVSPVPGHFAGRDVPAGYTYFVDEYNAEFSRDIEPAQGELQDDFYYQFVAAARRYKGVRPVPPVRAAPVRIDGKFDDWAAVTPEYRDDIGDPVHRDAVGWGGVHVVNQTGRNDLVAMKVSYDADRVYFYVRTAAPLTPHTDPNWMLLYLSVAPAGHANWLGYDFVVNRSVPGHRTTRLQRATGGGYCWSDQADVPYATAGNELELAIPRSALNLPAGPVTIDFKWADNIQQTGDASDFTLNGDVAPNDRFNYRARLGG